MSSGGGAGTHHDPAVLRRDRLRHELERRLDAVPAGALRGLPRPGPRAARAASCRAGSSRSRGSCTAASAGRGSSPRARRRWAASRSTRGSRSSAAPADFYEQLDPELIAEHIARRRAAATCASSSSARWSASTRAVARPAAARARGACTSASSSSCPTSSATVTDADRREHRPAARRQADGDPPDGGAARSWPTGSSSRSARKELRFIINFGFLFGFVLGIPLIFLTEVVFPHWWVLPIGGVIIGYVDQLAGDLDDLRAGRAAQDRPLHVPGPVPAPPAGGLRRLRRDHRRRHRHGLEHRRGAAARPALGPHARR